MKESKEMKGIELRTDAPVGGMLGHGVFCLELLYVLPMDLKYLCDRRTECGEQRRQSEGGCSVGSGGQQLPAHLS